MRITTSEGAIQINPSRAGVTLTAYENDLNKIPKTIATFWMPLTWDDAEQMHQILGEALAERKALVRFKSVGRVSRSKSPKKKPTKRPKKKPVKRPRKTR